MDSDDSEFYGDLKTVSGLKRRVNAFDADTWIGQTQDNPGHPKPRRALEHGISHLHNPYEGVSYAWQLTETVDAFLSRLPPSITDQSETVPWIFICNPYIPRVDKRNSDSRISKGNEDEAPQEEGSRLDIIIKGGMERLDLVTSFVEQAKNIPRAASTVEREINKERKQAGADILDLAHVGRIRPGKWMLFCTTAEVDEVWAIVARATANNELGIAAKVAPRPEVHDPRRERLICVYSVDFRDKADVGRVLQRLRELKLVEARGRPIYYKPDVYTYLGISSGNPWGLKASIYTSNDVFPE